MDFFWRDKGVRSQLGSGSVLPSILLRDGKSERTGRIKEFLSQQALGQDCSSHCYLKIQGRFTHTQTKKQFPLQDIFGNREMDNIRACFWNTDSQTSRRSGQVLSSGRVRYSNPIPLLSNWPKAMPNCTTALLISGAGQSWAFSAETTQRPAGARQYSARLKAAAGESPAEGTDEPINTLETLQNWSGFSKLTACHSSKKFLSRFHNRRIPAVGWTYSALKYSEIVFVSFI